MSDTYKDIVPCRLVMDWKRHLLASWGMALSAPKSADDLLIISCEHYKAIVIPWLVGRVG